MVTNDLAQAFRALGDELASDIRRHYRVTGGGPAAGTASDPPGRHLPDRSGGGTQCFPPCAGAQIEVEISYSEQVLGVRIRDDGRGIDRKSSRRPHRPLRSAGDARAGRTNRRGVERLDWARRRGRDRVEYPRGDRFWHGSGAQGAVVEEES